MTFKLTLERLPVRLETEVGSIAEAVGLLQEQDSTIHQMIAIADELSSAGETTATPPTTEAPRRGRKPKDKTPEAPSPVQVPPAAAPGIQPPAFVAPPDTTPNVNGIPAFLDRTQQAAPPPPPAPPPAPVAPSGILAGKIIANLDQRKAASPDNGKSLADWLGQCGLTQPGASYDEAIAVVRMTTDDKLQAIATNLGVA